MIKRYLENPTVITTLDMTVDEAGGVEQDAAMKVITEANRSIAYAKNTTQDSRTSTETEKPASAASTKLNKDELDTLAKQIVELYDDSLTFRGIAYHTDTPSVPVADNAWIATETDTYTNFGGIAVVEGQVIKYDGATYTANDVDGRITALETLKATLASPTFTGTVTLPKNVKIKDTSADHTYDLAVSELADDRTVTLPLLLGNDEFVFKDFIQTLTNKRLTSPKLNEDVVLSATATELNAVTANVTGATEDIRENQVSIKNLDEAVAKSVRSGNTIEDTDYEIVPLDAQALSAPVAVGTEYKGLTATHELDGEDEFATVGNWLKVGTAVALAVSNNELIIEGDGSSASIIAYTASGKSVDLSAYYYTHFLIKSDTAIDHFKLYYDGSTAGANKEVVSELSVSVDTWYLLSARDTLPADATGVSKFIIEGEYADAATSNGAKMYIKPVFINNTTNTFGTGNEPSEADCLKIFPRYFSGTQSVKGDGCFKTVGKNLLLPLKNSITFGGLTIQDDGDGYIKVNGTAVGSVRLGLKGFAKSGFSASDFLDSFRTTGIGDHTFSFSSITGSKTGTSNVIILLDSSAGETESVALGVDETLTSTNSIWGLYLIATTGATFTNYRFRLQLEDNDAMTTYAPFISHLKFWNAGQDLRSVPAIEDRAFWDAGRLWLEQNVETGALGSELVTDGDMSNAGAWTTGAGWDINSTVAGKAYYDNSTTSYIGQNATITDGKLYCVEFDISNGTTISLGLATPAGGNIGSGIGTPYKTGLGDGHHIFYFVASSSQTGIRVYSTTHGAFELDNLSIKEIATTAGTPLATIDEDEASNDGTNGFYQLETPLTTEIEQSGDFATEPLGTTYRLPWTPEVGLYGTGVTATGIKTLEAIWKFDPTTGAFTALDVSDATVTEDVGFTHTELLVTDWFYCFYSTEDTRPEGELTVGAYNNIAQSEDAFADAVNGTTYEVLITDTVILADSSTGTTAVDISSDRIGIKRQLIIKDSGGTASTANITISTEGSETIDGNATYTISTDDGFVVLASDGSNLYVVGEK